MPLTRGISAGGGAGGGAAAVAEFDFKNAARAASTANVALTGLQTIDGVSLVDGDRVLLKDQAAGAENGIWVVRAGAWERPADAVTGTLTAAAIIAIEEGFTYDDSHWILSTNNPITVGTTALSWSQFGAAASLSLIAPTLLWGSSSVGSSTTTRYLTPGYINAIASVVATQFRSTRAGTLRKLRVRHGTPSGNGNSIVYTIRVNNVASSVSASLASTATDGSDLSNSVSVSAGDLIDIEVTKATAVGPSPMEVVAVVEFAE